MPIILDLDYKEEGVTLRDPANNDLRHFVLREFDGKARDKYMNGLVGVVKTGPDKKPTGIKNFDGLQANLVVACMFEATRTGQGTDESPFVYTKAEPTKGVKKEWVQSLPASVGGAIFEACQGLCGLGDDAEKDAKED